MTVYDAMFLRWLIELDIFISLIDNEDQKSIDTHTHTGNSLLKPFCSRSIDGV